jgi:transketolase
MRNRLGDLLANLVIEDEKVWVLTGDLGYGVLNKVKENAPQRFYNVGAAEQLLLGIAVGLAHNKQIPICYSITPFLIFRPYEWIRNYLSHENTPVKLIGIGRDDDYGHLGFSHWGYKDEEALSLFPNIKTFRPNTIKELEEMWFEFIYNKKPSYINIARTV